MPLGQNKFMKTNIAIIGVILAMAVVWTLTSPASNNVNPENQIVATMYKTPTCGCCHVYGQYLKRQKINLAIIDLDDISSIKEEYGISRDMESCHTTVVEGYVIEGHIPMEVIAKLLSERPDIRGIALPGMPSGSPGMPGPKTGEWIFYSIGHNGEVSEYFKM